MGHRPKPPLTNCAGCGRSHRAWREGDFCPKCRREASTNKPAESLRAFRNRINHKLGPIAALGFQSVADCECGWQSPLCSNADRVRELHAEHLDSLIPEANVSHPELALSEFGF